MIVNFREISVKATKRWVDKDGKKHQKTKRFYQTISPFNLDKDKNIKSERQIWHEIQAERKRWLAEKEPD